MYMEKIYYLLGTETGKILPVLVIQTDSLMTENKKHILVIPNIQVAILALSELIFKSIVPIFAGLCRLFAMPDFSQIEIYGK